MIVAVLVIQGVVESLPRLPRVGVEIVCTAAGASPQKLRGDLSGPRRVNQSCSMANNPKLPQFQGAEIFLHSLLFALTLVLFASNSNMTEISSANFCHVVFCRDVGGREWGNVTFLLRALPFFRLLSVSQAGKT